MLKRLMLIALPLLALEAPKPLTDKQRADYATAVARVAIAQAAAAEARARMLEAQAQQEQLIKALRERIEALRKESGAAAACELDLEGKWQCESSPR